jgi:ferredoxin-NADP reductase
MKAVFIRKHPEAPNIITFWFRADRPVDYLAGQYVELWLPHDHPDRLGDKRWFTLSSSPTDNPLVSITTKFSKQPSSFKQTLGKLETGTSVNLGQGVGDFVLPKQVDRQLIFVAGGIGIVPFHSIVKWLIDTKQKRDIRLIYALSSEKELIFQSVFEEYGIKTQAVIKRPDPDWTGLTGRLDAKRILDLAAPGPQSLLYISGPNPFTGAISAQLSELGVPRQQIVTDYYSGYSQI